MQRFITIVTQKTGFGSGSKGRVIQAVRHQSQKKKLTFLVQGARQRRPDAVIHVGRRRLFAENFFLGSQKNIL
jgi:hypothetical protein